MRTGADQSAAHAANQEWSLDFVADALASGRVLRVLTMVYSFTRECPVIEVNTGISGQQVTRALDRVIEQRGPTGRAALRQRARIHQPHFIGWCEEKKIAVNYIHPGKPIAERLCGELQRPAFAMNA